MDRKRGVPSRPAASEETTVWNQARTQLMAFSKMYSNPATASTIGRVNRCISGWPSDDTVPAEGLEDVQQTYNRLMVGLKDVEDASNKEVKAIEQTLEKLGVLIALRQAPEPDKRNKRPRPPSPSNSVAHAAPPAPTTRTSVSITLPPRNQAGTPLASLARGNGTRKDNIAKQLPLRPGRTIAFHPPPKSLKDEAESSDWILAIITKCTNADKNRYEVRDADDENPETYSTTIKSIIPLPDPKAAAGTPESLSSYPEHPKGATVLALYPDTSCFYRAEVITPPDRQAANVVPNYVLRFEDDGEQTQVCTGYFVVELPKDHS